MWNALPIEIQKLILDFYTFTCTSDSLISKQFYQKNTKLNIQNGITIPLNKTDQLVYNYPLKVNVTDVNFSNIDLLSRLPRCVDTLVFSENKRLPDSLLYKLIQSTSARYIKEIDISNTCLTSTQYNNSTFLSIYAIHYLFEQLENYSPTCEIYPLVNLRKIKLMHNYYETFDNILTKFTNNESILPLAPNLECVVFKDYKWKTSIED